MRTMEKKKMIDMHNHIIPNVDDGPQDKQEMIALLKQAADQNIKGVVATPHHLHYKYNNDFDTIQKLVDEINNSEEIKSLGVTIYPGQEVRITDEILNHLDNGKIKGINNTKYLLIELPSNRVPAFTQSIIYEIQTRGYIPIIAHPERNKEISQNINILYGLVSIGALSQVTASSLTGKFGKNIQKLSFQMIENNLVHFIASDAHNSQNRPFDLKEIITNKKFKKHSKTLEKLFQNSELMINDHLIKAKRPIEFKKKKFLSIF